MRDLWCRQATIVTKNIIRRLRSVPIKLAERGARRGITQAADVKPGPASADGLSLRLKNVVRMP